MPDEFERFFLLLALFELLDQLFCTGLCDGTDVLDHLFAAHPDTVIGDGDGALVFVRIEADFEFFATIEYAGVSQGFKAQFIERIGGVGDQFAQEDLFVGVKGMDHQVQQLCSLCLKLKTFLCFGHDALLSMFSCCI